MRTITKPTAATIGSSISLVRKRRRLSSRAPNWRLNGETPIALSDLLLPDGQHFHAAGIRCRVDIADRARVRAHQRQHLGVRGFLHRRDVAAGEDLLLPVAL